MTDGGSPDCPVEPLSLFVFICLIQVCQSFSRSMCGGNLDSGGGAVNGPSTCPYWDSISGSYTEPDYVSPGNCACICMHCVCTCVIPVLTTAGPKLCRLIWTSRNSRSVTQLNHFAITGIKLMLAPGLSFNERDLLLDSDTVFVLL